jgi:hypothetical protein
MADVAEFRRHVAASPHVGDQIARGGIGDPRLPQPLANKTRMMDRFFAPQYCVPFSVQWREWRQWRHPL